MCSLFTFLFPEDYHPFAEVALEYEQEEQYNNSPRYQMRVAG
jgi:hypothetical protein